MAGKPTRVAIQQETYRDIIIEEDACLAKATMPGPYGHMVAAACATCCTLDAHVPIGNEAKRMHNSATCWSLRVRSSGMTPPAMGAAE